MMKGSIPPPPEPDPFRAAFEALPPLASPKYMELLMNAPAEALPPQVLVRAFRQLINAKLHEAAERTLDRLFDPKDRYGYLKYMRLRIRQLLSSGYYGFNDDDLLSTALIELIEILPTKRGVMAERAWAAFSSQRVSDAWRRMAGRSSARVRRTREESSGEEVNLLDADEVATLEWVSSLRESKVEWIEDFIARTVADFTDPLMRVIAEDQLIHEPSPISALAVRHRISRYAVYRLLKLARKRLAAALIEADEPSIDTEWLERLYPQHH